MQTLKLSVSMPDETHPDMELRLSANDSDCDVIIALPMQSSRTAQVTAVPRDTEASRGDNDDYVLGGYAGI
ncbi:MAG TPA: hypothetical protein VNZ27_03620 [Rhodanobacter sp.]|jgi:hypothetical protein|nr:hypothetical protein [Rhodanobacter sp.]